MKFFQLNPMILSALTALTFMITGCGSGDTDSRPQIEISGTVTLNGDALTQASIHFRSSKTGESAYANLTPNGQYSLEFPKADVGSEYSVTVKPPVTEDENPLDMMNNKPKEKSKSIIPKKYTQLETSGLKATVEKAGNNEFDFELTGK